MPFAEDMDALALIGAEAAAHDGWSDLGRYCILKGQGLRQPSLKALDAFLVATTVWDFADRLAVTRWLLIASSRVNWRHKLISQPLYQRLIVPCLLEWSEGEPTAAEPLYWLGEVGHGDPSEHFRRALVLDSSCEPARQRLVDGILADISYNQHHMPHFYIHDPREDLGAFEEALRLLGESVDVAWAANARRHIGNYRAITEEWLAEHPEPGDFAAY